MSPTFIRTCIDAAETFKAIAETKLADGDIANAQRLLDLAQWHLDWAESARGPQHLSEAA